MTLTYDTIRAGDVLGIHRTNIVHTEECEDEHGVYLRVWYVRNETSTHD